MMMNLHLLPPILLFFLFFFKVIIIVIAQETVYLHVGPHKTGSTHVQKFATKYRQLLSDKYQICIPTSLTPPFQNKIITRAIIQLSSKGDISPLRRVIQSCQHQITTTNITMTSKSIFLSAENISILSIKYLKLIRQLFSSSSTKIYIIITYREWLEKMYSEYTQLAKTNIFHTETIGEYIYRNYGYINPSLSSDQRFQQGSYYFIDIMKNLQAVFHHHNNNTTRQEDDTIYIIDYLGIQKQSKDITYIIFCEIMKVLCEETMSLSSSQHSFQYNVKPEGQYIHLVSIVRDYIYLRRYSFHQHLPRFFTRDLVNNYTKQSLSLPIRASNLYLLHSYAIGLDETIRQQYNSLMMYANSTASRAAIESFHVNEIDTNKFYTQEKWIGWLENEFIRLQEIGVIIPKDQYYSQHHHKISETKIIKSKQ